MGLLSAQLWELGSAGIEETPAGLCAYFEDSADPETVRRALADVPTEIHPAPTFLEPSFLEQSDPVFAGNRFVIVPVAQAGAQRRLTPTRIVLPIDAAMAFGSGRHETTQLCLEALETLIAPHQTVIDVGCGSGILALAASLLGARRVIAADIDEPAVNVARRHFPGPLLVGSADCFASESADLVLCNITGKIDDRLAPHIQRILKPTGRAILSGFTHATSPRNFLPERSLEIAGWLCWICTRIAIHPEINPDQPSNHAIQWWL